MEDAITAATRILRDAPKSMGELIRWRVELTPDRLAFRHRRPDESWAELTWRQTGDQVDRIAAGLLSLGLQTEERVAIASGTRVEWILADYAVNAAGGATTTVYPNTGPEDFQYIVEHSASVILIADTPAQLEKVGADHGFRYQILMDGQGDGDRILSWQQLLERGDALLKENPQAVREATAKTGRGNLSTLIYTSGTTGRPKGVELTHENWIFVGLSVNDCQIITAKETQFLWLPLSHVFGKALLAIQLAIGFVTTVDGRLDMIVPGLGETHPSLMCGAPRIFEKVRNVALSNNAAGIKGKIATWAFSVGREARDYKLAGTPLPGLLGVKHRIADKLVFSKLRERLGGNINFLVSGSAKLNPQVQDWFYAAGILIVEGYGLTENSAVGCVNHPATPRFGTVGPPIPGMEVRIAEDGEVLLRGPGVMRGYHKAPELTAEVIIDGWFHTGDIGKVDSDGYLTLTDRKKDLMKTSGGKYVAPMKVEGAITAALPYASQVVVVGDGRKYISALITMDQDTLRTWAERKGLGDVPYAELTQRPELRASVEARLADANSRLERWETVKKFTILDHEFSVDSGGVTPSMKLRRAAIAKQYASVVDSMYEDEGLGAA